MKEERGLLLDEGHNDEMEMPRKRPRSARQGFVMSWFNVYLILIHVLLVSMLLMVLNLWISVSVTDSFTTFPGLRRLGVVIKAEHSASNSSPFSGPPSGTNTMAWQRLLQPIYFNATTEELSAADVSIEGRVKVQGGGFLAALGVYHELYCIDQLRHSLYRDHFYPELASSEIGLWREHLDHCLEVLRLSAMCTGDSSLYTFTWPSDEEARFLEAQSSSSRKCVNWKQLEEWAYSRQLPWEPVLLKPSGDTKILKADFS